MDIIKIVIKGESGFGPAEEAFKDKITITESSIRDDDFDEEPT